MPKILSLAQVTQCKTGVREEAGYGDDLPAKSSSRP